MRSKFEVLFLEEAIAFLERIDQRDRIKIIKNIDKARYVLDPKLFKKLGGEIWEFRTSFGSRQYRVLAFWDKRIKSQTLVVATHGFVKKSQKTPKTQIAKAESIRSTYFET